MKLHAILTEITVVHLPKPFNSFHLASFQPPSYKSEPFTYTKKKTAMNERSFLEFSIVGVLISSGKRSVTLVISMSGIRNLKPWQRFL